MLFLFLLYLKTCVGWLLAFDNLLAWLSSQAGISDSYPEISWPALPDVETQRAKGNDSFVDLLEDYLLKSPPYLLSVIAPNSERWKVYRVEDLIGHRGHFHCRHVTFTDFHRSYWGKSPHRFFLHLLAEWSRTVPEECFFLMSAAATDPPTGGFQYFGRYPAALNLMYLLSSGVISSDAHQPFLLYIDTDLLMTRAGAGVQYILDKLERAAPLALESQQLRLTAATPPTPTASLFLATDPGCARDRSRWPRMNSGTILFRSEPLVAAIFEATYLSWSLQRPHPYDRLDQAMLALVLNETIDFPHDHLRELCRSDAKKEGPAEELWRAACDGGQIVWQRDFLESVPHRAESTEALIRKWKPKGGSVAMLCARVLGGSMMATPRGLPSDIWTWRCGDLGMHMIGGLNRVAKLTPLSRRWREERFRNCSGILPFKTLLDGHPFWEPEPSRTDSVFPLLRGSDISPINLIDARKEQ